MNDSKIPGNSWLDHPGYWRPPSYPGGGRTPTEGEVDHAVWVESMRLLRWWCSGGNDDRQFDVEHLEFQGVEEEPELSVEALGEMVAKVGDDPEHRSVAKPHTLDWWMEREAKRALPTRPKERGHLIEKALEYVSSFAEVTANVWVQARCSIEIAKDQEYRANLRPAFARQSRVWWKEYAKTGEATQHGTFQDADAWEAITPDQFDLVRKCGVKLREVIAKGVIEEPRHGLRFGEIRCADALRPPIAALSVAAHLLAPYLDPAKPQVLGVELGHTAGAQTLSLLLPTSVVLHTTSLVHDTWAERTIGAEEADAVVLNIPNGAAMEYAGTLCNAEIPITGGVLRYYWKLSKSLRGSHSLPLVEIATKHLKPGGLLVVMGDIESGVHHQANAAIRRADLAPLEVLGCDLVSKPIKVLWGKPAWAPWGGLRPTDRLLSAWEKSQ